MSRRPLLALTLLALLATSASALTIIDPGTVMDTDPVSCGAHKGTVTIRTGVHFQEGEVDFPNGVSLEFGAAQGSALDCCWVQFTRAQAVATTQSSTHQLGGVVPTTGGPVDLSTDAAPSWHVDSSGKSPCYEAAASSFKDASSARMYDSPGNMAEFLVAGLPATIVPKKVEVVWHFVAYLVCGRRVCATAVWTLKQTWTAAPSGSGPGAVSSTFDPKPTVTPGGTIDPKQTAAANAEHAGQTMLPP